MVNLVKIRRTALRRYGDSPVVKITRVRHVGFLKNSKQVHTGYTVNMRHDAEFGEDDRTVAEIRADNGSVGHVGHASNGSTNIDGSRGSGVCACDPLTHDTLTDD